MVDVHSHILHGLDDGAKSFEDSLAMARMAKAAGATDIVATPHANLTYRFQPELVEQRLVELREAGGDSVPRLHYGCDFHLAFDNIQDAIANPRKYTIGHLNYLLVEFSDLAIFHTTAAVLENLIAAGMIPVITHPERNALLRKRMGSLREWVEMGCLIQVTAQSFLGRWGNPARQFSAELMKEGLAHVVASDGHDTVRRPPVLDEARRYLAAEYGTDTADRLLNLNPRAIVEGKPLPAHEPETVARERRWYTFWR